MEFVNRFLNGKAMIVDPHRLPAVPPHDLNQPSFEALLLLPVIACLLFDPDQVLGHEQMADGMGSERHAIPLLDLFHQTVPMIAEGRISVGLSAGCEKKRLSIIQVCKLCAPQEIILCAFSSDVLQEFLLIRVEKGDEFLFSAKTSLVDHQCVQRPCCFSVAASRHAQNLMQ